MKMICPHCCGEQQYSIKVLIHPDCKNCGKNMTRSINKKFSRCKGIAMSCAFADRHRSICTIYILEYIRIDYFSASICYGRTDLYENSA